MINLQKMWLPSCWHSGSLGRFSLVETGCRILSSYTERPLWKETQSSLQPTAREELRPSAQQPSRNWIWPTAPRVSLEQCLPHLSLQVRLQPWPTLGSWWETLEQRTQISGTWIPTSATMRYKCYCFKPLRLRLIYYIWINNTNYQAFVVPLFNVWSSESQGKNLILFAHCIYQTSY